MIEFKQLTDRIFSILKHKISNEVFKVDYIDYPQLKKYVEFLKCEPLLQESTLPVIISLSESFHAGNNIDWEIKELYTYHSIIDQLIECEFIKEIQQSNNKVKPVKSNVQGDYSIFEPPSKYEIINTKEFNGFTIEIRKATIIYITRVRLGSFIEGKLDEISNRGQFASNKVSMIFKEIQEYQKKWAIITKSINVEEKNKFKVKEKSNDKIEGLSLKYKTFYSSRIAEYRNSNYQETLNVFDSIFQSMVDNGFLSRENNSSKQLLDLFTIRNISQKNIIRWKGTAYELRFFTNLIADSGLCIHLGGLYKWKIVLNCFHCKLRGKPMGKIEYFESISQSSKTKSDKSEKLKPIVDKLKQINL